MTRHSKLRPNGHEALTARVLASALLGLLVGLLTTILLVVPAGAAFVAGGKPPSDQPTYSYYSPSAATTLPVNLRTAPLAVRPSPRAAPEVVRLVSGVSLAAKATTEVDHVVLGHYTAYLESAASSGGRTFQVPKHIWDAMSPEKQGAANQKFLDRAIARGSAIRLATPANAAREVSYYERELQYLTSKGDRPNASETRMTPPGG
jgi:hypothetical protein